MNYTVATMTAKETIGIRYWHAVYVKSRYEKKVFDRLTDLGIKAYLPLVTLVKQWSDRRKKVEEPLFKSYVFVFNNEKEYLDILNITGVVKFVSFEHKAVVVPESQIVAIKCYIDDYEQGKAEKAMRNEDLKIGQLVRITHGPMQGLIGRLESVKDKRLVVYIEAVGQYLPVSIPRTKVEPVQETENLSLNETE